VIKQLLQIGMTFISIFKIYKKEVVESFGVFDSLFFLFYFYIEFM